MEFVNRDEDGPFLILEARDAERLLLQRSVSGSPSWVPYFRARSERFHVYVCVCMYVCMRARFTRSYADDSVAKRAGQHTAGAPSGARQDGGDGGEGGGAHRRSKQHRAGGRQQCRPRSGPDGGTRGHIPRWLCLRNAVGAPLRRLPPSFFINRSHLPVLAKRNPLITARAR